MSGVLLDTCALIWTVEGAAMSTLATRSITLAAQDGGLFVSPVSAWEVALLASRKRFQKITTVNGARRWFAACLARGGIRPAPFDHVIALDSVDLPGLAHRDPVDRFLIATARHLHLPIVTGDDVILDYARTGHVQCIPC